MESLNPNLLLTSHCFYFMLYHTGAHCDGRFCQVLLLFLFGRIDGLSFVVAMYPPHPPPAPRLFLCKPRSRLDVKVTAGSQNVMNDVRSFVQASPQLEIKMNVRVGRFFGTHTRSDTRGVGREKDSPPKERLTCMCTATASCSYFSCHMETRRWPEWVHVTQGRHIVWGEAPTRTFITMDQYMPVCCGTQTGPELGARVPGKTDDTYLSQLRSILDPHRANKLPFALSRRAGSKFNKIPEHTVRSHPSHAPTTTPSHVLITRR